MYVVIYRHALRRQRYYAGRWGRMMTHSSNALRWPTERAAKEAIRKGDVPAVRNYRLCVEGA